MFPADTQVAFWPQWFTMDNRETHHANRWFLLSDGRKCAANCEIAVVTDDVFDQIPGTHDEIKLKTMGDTVLQMLAKPHEKHVSMPHAEAVALFGPCEHSSSTTCTNCKGTGTVSHHCYCELCEAKWEPCDVCDETGVDNNLPNVRYCSLWGQPFDANNIAYIFAHAPETIAVDLELVKYWPSQHILRITTSRWQAVIVELTGSELTGNVLLTGSKLTGNVLPQHDCPELMEAIP